MVVKKVAKKLFKKTTVRTGRGIKVAEYRKKKNPPPKDLKFAARDMGHTMVKTWEPERKIELPWSEKIRRREKFLEENPGKEFSSPKIKKKKLKPNIDELKKLDDEVEELTKQSDIDYTKRLMEKRFKAQGVDIQKIGKFSLNKVNLGFGQGRMYRKRLGFWVGD